LIEKQIKIAFAQQEMQLQSAWNKRKALLWLDELDKWSPLVSFFCRKGDFPSTSICKLCTHKA
jgi:hypothetical protein